MKIALWGCVKFILWRVAIAALIYFTYLIWYSIKADALTTPFISIMMSSAAATVGVVGATILLGLIGIVMYNKLSKVKIEESRPIERLSDLIVADDVKEKLQCFAVACQKKLEKRTKN